MNKRATIILVLFFLIGTSLGCIAKQSNEIFSYFKMTKNDLIKKLGNTYEIVPAGEEGTYDGYQYKILGITIVFNDYEEVDFIHCNEKVSIDGAKAGMNFSQIQKKLGKAAIKETFVETESNKAYEIEYIIDNCIVRFLSFEKDGKDSGLTIFRKYDQNDVSSSKIPSGQKMGLTKS